MRKKENSKLVLEIARCKEKLSKLTPMLEESAKANEDYNRILIHKAACQQELKENQTSLFTKFINKFKRNKERCICDYFGK